MNLYAHQSKGVAWLLQRQSAGLWWEMGCGKSRTALDAARLLYEQRKIDRVLILAPAAVRFAWKEELAKLSLEGFNHNLLRYESKMQRFLVESVGGNLNGNPHSHIPIAVMSYSLLSQGDRSKRTDKHTRAVEAWCRSGRTALICDESSFLKSRTAKQTKAAMHLAVACQYRWLLSGTPICNSPLDLYAQGKVMSPVRGPLGGYDNFYHFQASIGDLIPIMAKNGKPLRVVGRGAGGRIGFQTVKRFEPRKEGLVKLQKMFAPYVSRVEKRDCLDLPAKSYTVREVPLTDATWKIYQELRREAMLALPDSEAKPEPNAAVRILRLCQLTSGHVGATPDGVDWHESLLGDVLQNPSSKVSGALNTDVSSEKLDYVADAIFNGELLGEQVLICWCRWRRERERLKKKLKELRYEKFKENNNIGPFFPIYEIFGGQSQKEREEQIQNFQCSAQYMRSVLLAQQHAGGFGLNLTAAHTAVYLSNDWSYSTRIQSEDRTHRINQTNPCLYIDVVAVGPKGQKTVDHAVLEALREKKSIAEFTCQGWRRALEEE